MECYICGADMASRVGEVDYQCGLPGIRLAGVTIHECAECGEDSYEVPALETLHKTLAFVVAQKDGALSGVEIKFLRKWLGWSSQGCARRLRLTPQTYSSYENGRRPMGQGVEQLLRLLAVTTAPVESYAVEQSAEDRAAASHVRELDFCNFQGQVNLRHLVGGLAKPEQVQWEAPCLGGHVVDGGHRHVHGVSH